uniref:acetyl-coenzyme A synthetase N-terminal domain-containing protein n=1 Tax=uncultured Mameliella sp. TaxID=1447087 RepID=UPI0026373F8D
MTEQTTPETATPVYPPSAEMAAKAHVDASRYDEMYAASVSDPEGFWAEQAQ